MPLVKNGRVIRDSGARRVFLVLFQTFKWEKTNSKTIFMDWVPQHLGRSNKSKKDDKHYFFAALFLPPTVSTREAAFGLELSFFLPPNVPTLNAARVHFYSVMGVFRWHLQKLVFSIHFRPIGKPSLVHCANLVSCFPPLCCALKNLWLQRANKLNPWGTEGIRCWNWRRTS